MEEIEKKNEPVFLLNQAISRDTPICRYMDFDAFLSILEGSFYVPRRNNFYDIREHGNIPLKMHFAITSPRETGAGNTALILNHKEKVNSHQENLKKTTLLLSSCWTRDRGYESYLMWKSYTSRCGVCLHTTIGKLMESIDFDGAGYIPVCSPMYYYGYNLDMNVLEGALSKDKYYDLEDEIRFYFLPKSILPQEGLLNSDTDLINGLFEKTYEEEQKKNGNKDNSINKCPAVIQGATFNISPVKCIDKITISPSIHRSNTRHIINSLKKLHPEIFDKKRKIIYESKLEIRN